MGTYKTGLFRYKIQTTVGIKSPWGLVVDLVDIVYLGIKD